MKKNISGLLIASTLIFAMLFSASVNAAPTKPATLPHIVSIDNETGIKIIKDAAGGTIVSGLPTPYVASFAEQQNQMNMFEYLESGVPSVMSSAPDEYYDIEENPIYIGTWNDVDCYARHTLGSYNSTLGYLTSYGDCSWYNTSGWNALPYRNGAATVADQAVVDVAKYSTFNIRDLTTDTSTSLIVNDWGPNQNEFPDRIADIDKNAFKDLHGNTTDGLFYCRTWVPISNYNP